MGEGQWVSASAEVDTTVAFRGPALIGPRARLRSGALIGEGVLIGPDSVVEEYSRVAKYSYVGSSSRIGHGAAVSGLLFGHNTVKHPSYFRGAMGFGVNLGAGTFCGTDRFDGGSTRHYRNGVRVVVAEGANEVYFGSGSRTGVGTCVLPGSMIGRGCTLGPGVVFSGYLLDHEEARPSRAGGLQRRPRRRVVSPSAAVVG